MADTTRSIRVGRPPGPPRIQVSAYVLERGRRRHLLSLMCGHDLGAVMRALQALAAAHPPPRSTEEGM